MNSNNAEVHQATAVVSGSAFVVDVGLSDSHDLEPRLHADDATTTQSSQFISSGRAFDRDFFFVDADSVGSVYGHTAAESVIPGTWVRPVSGAMCGLLGYVVAPDTLYVLSGRGDLVVVRDDYSNVYRPGEGHSVLNAVALRPTTPDVQELERYRRCSHPLLLRLALPVPSPAVWLGDRVVVTEGEHIGQSGVIVEIRMFDSATQRTYFAEVQPLEWDHSSPARPIHAPVAALARHAFDSFCQFLLFDRVRVISDPLYGGAVGRVVDICGFDITVSVDAASPLSGPTAPCNVLLGQRSFVVQVETSRREWRIGDVFLVRAGEQTGVRATAVRGGRANVIELVQTSHPRLSFTANFSDLEFDFTPHVPQPLSTIPQSIDFPHVFDRTCLKKRKRGERFEGIEVQIIRGVHKGFRGTVIGDYDSESRARRLDWQEDPSPTDFAGILLSIRDLSSNRILTGVRVEDVCHAASMQYMNDAIQLPPEVFFGTNTMNKIPRVVGLFRTIPERRNVTPPPDPTAGPLWPSFEGIDAASPTLMGEFTGMWMCAPAFAGKKLDVRIHGVHQLKIKVAKRILGLEGRAGWILLETAVDPAVQKLPVSNVGVNWTRHLVHRNCIRPRRDDDEGRCISATTHRVIVVGPDIHSNTDKLGWYAVPIPTWPHTYGNGVVCLRFEDGSEGVVPIAGLCLSKNDEIRTETYTYQRSEFV